MSRPSHAAAETDDLRRRLHLAFGNPPDEILKTAEREQCDLIAMTTHGHRLLGDLIHGSTITAVRHKSQIPLLIVRAGDASRLSTSSGEELPQR